MPIISGMITGHRTPSIHGIRTVQPRERLVTPKLKRNERPNAFRSLPPPRLLLDLSTLTGQPSRSFLPSNAVMISTSSSLPIDRAARLLPAALVKQTEKSRERAGRDSCGSFHFKVLSRPAAWIHDAFRRAENYGV